MPAITEMAQANRRELSRAAWALLALIMVAGGVARFWNLDWDHGAYTLHPDEWALNEVVRRIFPDPNPHFFFYGGFPIYLDRFTAEVLSFLTGENWLDRVRLALVGRFYSALQSTLILPLLFDAGRRLWSVWAGLIAAACGAGAALLIQAAHFGTVDTLLALEGMYVLWASLRIASEPRSRWYVLAGVALGLAVATKLTGATLVLMPLLAHLARSRRGPEHRPLSLLPALAMSAVVVCLLASPYYLLDLPGLWAAIQEQSGELGGTELSYTWQFIGSTPYVFELSNLVTWGLGIPLGIAALGGWVWAIGQTTLRRTPALLVLTVWPTLYFLMIGTWQARFVRHALPLVPFCCLFAAGGLTALYGLLGARPAGKWTASALTGATVIGACLWGLAYLSIYTSPDTRLAASAWIEANVPAGSNLVLEDKNQPLPVLPTGDIPITYNYSVLAITAPDTSTKMNDFASILAAGDVLVVPNRRWSSVLPRTPGFERTARYYLLLFNGELGYTPLATFTDPPRLGPLTWPDDSAEETFQVFDHPTVLLFSNTGHLSADELQALLNAR